MDDNQNALVLEFSALFGQGTKGDFNKVVEGLLEKAGKTLGHVVVTHQQPHNDAIQDKVESWKEWGIKTAEIPQQLDASFLAQFMAQYQLNLNRTLFISNDDDRFRQISEAGLLARHMEVDPRALANVNLQDMAHAKSQSAFAGMAALLENFDRIATRHENKSRKQVCGI